MWSKQEQETRDVGRPTDYTQDLAAEFCARIARGESVRKVCEADDMPSRTTVFNWLHEHSEFVDQYTRAKEDSAEAMAEEIMEIVDDAKEDKNALMKAKLRADTRMWLMTKMKPKKYGPKVDVTSDGKALPSPIYGGMSATSTPNKRPDEATDSNGPEVPIPGHYGDQKDIPTQ